MSLENYTAPTKINSLKNNIEEFKSIVSNGLLQIDNTCRNYWQAHNYGSFPISPYNGDYIYVVNGEPTSIFSYAFYLQDLQNYLDYIIRIVEEYGYRVGQDQKDNT